MDDTKTLLAQILDHPLVKAYGEGKGWWEHDVDHNGMNFFVRAEIYTGPDLALPSNLHELLGLADAMCFINTRANLVWSINRYSCSLPVPNQYKDRYVILTCHGPTRTLAVLAALGRALGIEVEA